MSQSLFKNAFFICLSIFQYITAQEAYQIRMVVCFSEDKNVTFYYEDADQICASGLLNVTKDTYINVHGYNAPLTNEGPRRTIGAITATGEFNCIGIAWDLPTGVLAPLDFAAITKLAAEQLKKVLIILSSCLQPMKLRMIGISIGAHISCNAASGLQLYTNSPVFEIITCDPSYIKGLLQPCDATSALYVYHFVTDKYYFGERRPQGDITVWFNLDTYEKTHHQPNCPVPGPDYPVNMSPANICNHKRAVLILVMVLLHTATCLFKCVKADSTADFVAQRIQRQFDICLNAINRTNTGDYYCTTSGNEPYGLGEEGTKPAVQPESETETSLIESMFG